MVRSLLLLLLLVVSACGQPAPAQPRPSAAPDVVADVLAGFSRAPVVAIGEHHRSVPCHAFLQQLVRDPRFLATVDDIVVEFANQRLQPVLDRYIAGDAVEEVELRHVWQDTTQLLVWDAPMYRELLDTVRAINTASSGRKLRVLAGDPPIDWSKVRSRADYEPFGARDPDTARVIEREVLAKRRKALLVIGTMHLTEVDPLAAARGKPGSPSLSQLLQPDRVYTVWTAIGATPLTEGWRTPELRVADGTPLGKESFAKLMRGTVTLLVEVDGKRVPRDVEPAQLPPIEDVVDAVLYLGPDTAKRDAPPETYRDTAYVEALRTRAAVMKEVFGIDFAPDIDAEVTRAGG